MKKPIIGITTNLLTVEEGLFSGTTRLYINRDYAASTVRAGAIPLLLPILQDEAMIRQQIELIDALIVSGGQDVSPQHYGEENSPWLEATLLERDLFEMMAIRHAVELEKPIFGVCRGLQLLNVFFGGSLYQDIPHQVPTSLSHLQKTKKEEASHTVTLQPNSWLHTIYGKEKLQTNSFHHQAIKKLAPAFQATAHTDDGIIEAIERREGSFIVAVQWHPEMMTAQSDDMQALFQAFVTYVQMAGSIV